MAQQIEVLESYDVIDIVSEWLSQNINEYVPTEYEIEQIVESQIESEVNYGQIDTAMTEVRDEFNEVDDKVDRLADDQNEYRADFRHLEERVADLERKNAKLLETLSQFAQLLTNRDLI